jgi:hypothetical protein
VRDAVCKHSTERPQDSDVLSNFPVLTENDVEDMRIANLCLKAALPSSLMEKVHPSLPVAAAPHP